MNSPENTYSVSIPYRRPLWTARLQRWVLLLLVLALYCTPILYCWKHANVNPALPGSSAWYQLPLAPWPHS